jgi:hypothetical protein
MTGLQIWANSLLLIGAILGTACGSQNASPVDGGPPDAGRVDGGVQDAGPADASIQLDYFYGNQITGSYLQIDKSGEIAQRERTCCPPQFRDVPFDRIDDSMLRQLEAAIVAVASGTITVESRPTLAGEQVGSLRVTTSSGAVVDVRTYTLSEMSWNTAPESNWIQSLANQYVQVKMPE